MLLLTMFEDKIPQIVQSVITLGFGTWLVKWLQDVIKETFKKIDTLEKEINDLKTEARLRKEIEAEFKKKYNA